jgi:WD40 repeat protein
MMAVKNGRGMWYDSHDYIVPGFRSYRTEEQDIYFGKSKESEQILDKIRNNRFYALIGECASGKSSLINCRIIPSLIVHQGQKVHVFKLDSARRPYQQLSAQLSDFIEKNKRDIQGINSEDVETVLRGSSLGLVNILSKTIRKEEEVFLLIDQFEELFIVDHRNGIADHHKERQRFFNLLTETIDCKDLNIHLLLIIRSEILGELFEYDRLAEMINQNSFLLKKTDHAQLADIIKSIITSTGFEIDEFNLNQIASNFESMVSPLMALQYSFSRKFNKWQSIKKSKEYDFSRLILDSDLANMVSMDLNSIYFSYSPEKRVLCERIVKLLFTTDDLGKVYRQSNAVNQLAEMTGHPEKQVIDVLLSFKLLQPAVFLGILNDTIDNNSTICLAHDLIIKLWDKLTKWIDEEKASIATYKRLSVRAELYQQGKDVLLTDTDLSLAIEWRERNKPTYSWGIRFHPAYNRTMSYIDFSQKKIVVDSNERHEKKLNRSSLYKYLSIGFGVIVILLVTSIIFLVPSKKKETTITRGSSIRMAEGNKKQDLTIRQTENEPVVQDQGKETNRSAQVRTDNASSERDIHRDVVYPTPSGTRPRKENNETLNTGKDSNESNSQSSQSYPITIESKVDHARIQALSRSLATESLQATDVELKSLLAYQSFLFNKRSDGPVYNPYVFMSLYNAIKFAGVDIKEYYTGHNKSVNSLAKRAGTANFYSAGNDGKVLEWSFSESKTTSNIVISNSTPYEVMEISNDGVWLAATTFDGLIHLINLKSGSNQPVVLSGHTGKIKSLAFTPDNDFLISSGTDKNVFLWNIMTGQYTELNNPYGIVLMVKCSPDNKYIVGGTRDGKILIWGRDDLQNSNILYSDAKNSIYSLEFNKAGTLVLAGDLYGAVHIFDFTGRRLLLKIQGHSARILDMAFSDDNKLMATASMDGSIRVWDVNNWNEPQIVFEDNEGFVFSVLFSPDNSKLLSCNSEGTRITLRTLSLDYMADRFCKFLSRNFTVDEWHRYVGSDIDYEFTCPDISLETNMKK